MKSVRLSFLMLIFIAPVFAQYPAIPYHPVDYDVSHTSFLVPSDPFMYADYITNVSFAGINNTTTAVLWKNDYSGTTHGNVVRGHSYTLSVTVNAGSDFSYQDINAFIDWNRNGDCGGRFPDHGGSGTVASEAYNIALGAGHANPASISITVPTDAALGTTWLRITLDADGGESDYLSYFGYGEIEEYAIEVIDAPTTQATNITLNSNAGGTSVSVGWTIGSGSSRAVFMKELAGAITNPTFGSTYSASTNWNSKGSQLGTSGYFCIYNGTGNSVTVTGTTANTVYVVQVFEYNGTGGNSVYNTSTATGNPNNETTLPVELASFSAEVSNSKSILSWNTSTEVNNYGFEVERRAVNSKELRVKSWEKLGFVTGHGNSSTPHEYSFTDTKISSGRYEYRLKQIDNDGSFKYSQSVEIEIAVPKEFVLSQNYPNPFNPTTTITYDIPNIGTQHAVSLRVYDILGKEVATLVNETKEAGSYEVKFDASNLSSGIYFFKLTAGQFLSIRKMTLLK